MKLRSNNFSLKRIDGTKPERIEQAYQTYLNRWKFNNSDKVWLDNELISKDEKNLIIESNYNIKPKPKSIITSDIEDKIPLTEDLFINEQIRLFKRIKAQTKGIEIDRVLYSKSKFYLIYLKKRLVEIKKTSTTEINDKDEAYNGDVFKSYDAQKLFMLQHEAYKNETTNRCANYSFIFYAMTDYKKLIRCNSAYYYKTFLHSLEIEIDRVDSRQSGVKKNYKFKLFKEHYKSVFKNK